MSELNINIQPVLEREAKGFILRVNKNLASTYPINAYLRTMDNTPLRDEASNEMLSIFGWQYIENVELGIPPLKGKGSAKAANPPVKEILYQWSKAAGISFEKDYQRRSFAFALRRKIWNEGTAHFRSGVRRDIYTSEQDVMIQNIMNEVGRLIINTKLT